MKTCIKCRSTRPLSMYYETHSGNKSRKCKVCVIARIKERAFERSNEETINEINDRMFVIKNESTREEVLNLGHAFLFTGDIA
jgi:hypothetical protein